MSKRLKFFISHLAISFLVLSLAALFIFLVWYPHPLAAISGVMPIFLMLLVIDVVLGPSLSLLVYKEGKKSLKFDLGVIILIQMSAFVYGIYSLAVTRPAWIVFTVDSFDLIYANGVDESHVKGATAAFRHPSWLGAQYAATLVSTDPKQRERDLFDELNGVALSQKPDRYLPLDKASEQIKAHANSLDGLYKFNQKNAVDALRKKYPDADSWFPLYKGDKDKVVLVNKNKAQAVAVVDLSPGS